MAVLRRRDVSQFMPAEDRVKFSEAEETVAIVFHKVDIPFRESLKICKFNLLYLLGDSIFMLDK